MDQETEQRIAELRMFLHDTRERVVKLEEHVRALRAANEAWAREQAQLNWEAQR